MNGMLLLSGVVILFLIAYIGYGAFLKRTFGVDPSRPCPSETKKDGIKRRAPSLSPFTRCGCSSRGRISDSEESFRVFWCDYNR